MNKLSKKYVFLDVDGTLVDFKSRVADSAVSALKQAQNNGHKMIIATGRQKSQIYPWLLEKVQFDGIMASSGAYIEFDGKVIYENHPTKEKLSQVIDFFHEYKISYFLQSKDALIVEKQCFDDIIAYMRMRGSSESVIKSIFENTVFTENPKECTYAEKIAYYNAPFGLDGVRKALGDYFYVVGYSIGEASSAYHGEITFDGINKGVGIQKFLEAVGAPVSDSIAVGDSENDLEMIKYAGVGIAMGNGYDVVKQAADFVTTDINEDGLLNAFKTVGLI